MALLWAFACAAYFCLRLAWFGSVAMSRSSFSTMCRCSCVFCVLTWFDALSSRVKAEGTSVDADCASGMSGIRNFPHPTTSCAKIPNGCLTFATTVSSCTDGTHSPLPLPWLWEEEYSITSWWLNQPTWKNINISQSQVGSFHQKNPMRKKKHVSCHHLSTNGASQKSVDFRGKITHTSIQAPHPFPPKKTEWQMVTGAQEFLNGLLCFFFCIGEVQKVG